MIYNYRVGKLTENVAKKGGAVKRGSLLYTRLGLEIKAISMNSWKKESYFFKLQCKFVYASRKNGSQYHVSKLT